MTTAAFLLPKALFGSMSFTPSTEMVATLTWGVAGAEEEADFAVRDFFVPVVCVWGAAITIKVQLRPSARAAAKARVKRRFTKSSKARCGSGSKTWPEYNRFGRCKDSATLRRDTNRTLEPEWGGQALRSWWRPRGRKALTG